MAPGAPRRRRPGQAGRPGDEVAPRNRGGQDVELTEKRRQALLRLGLEDEDRFLLGQKELVLSERRRAGSNGGPWATSPRTLGKCACL